MLGSCRLEAAHFLDLFGIAVTLNLDLRGGFVNLAEIVGRKFDGHGADVLVQAMQLGRAWNRHDPRLLGQQPGERNLSGCSVLLFADGGQKVNDRLVGLAGFGREPRQSSCGSHRS